MEDCSADQVDQSQLRDLELEHLLSSLDLEPLQLLVDRQPLEVRLLSDQNLLQHSVDRRVLVQALGQLRPLDRLTMLRRLDPSVEVRPSEVYLSKVRFAAFVIHEILYLHQLLDNLVSFLRQLLSIFGHFIYSFS